jgi:hypothetical protein
LPKLFEPFFTFGKSDGTGLGMAIAKSNRRCSRRKNFRHQRPGKRDHRRNSAPSDFRACAC